MTDNIDVGSLSPNFHLIDCVNCLDSGIDDACWCHRCHICQDVLDDVCDYPEGY